MLPEDELFAVSKAYAMPASSSSSRWSWLHKLKLRRKKRNKKSKRASPVSTARASDATSRQPPAAVAGSLSPCCCYCPNRESYYLNSADRARQEDRQDMLLRCDDEVEEDGEALDVRVDVVHRRADGLDAPPATPELKLRPIVTSRRHTASKNEASDSSSTSAATTPSTRAARGFHVGPTATSRRLRRVGSGRHDSSNAAGPPVPAPASSSLSAGRPSRRRRMWLRESEAVVMESLEPELELVDSMIEMLCTNGVRRLEDLQDLLACYLSLNAAEHHRTIVTLFRRVVLVWIHLGSQRLLPGQ
uniref:Transcription repressor n=1 Tax=Oryza punctata TaxID=4537 RepID=A0A0E0KDG2_ORYPU